MPGILAIKNWAKYYEFGNITLGKFSFVRHAYPEKRETKYFKHKKCTYRIFDGVDKHIDKTIEQGKKACFKVPNIFYELLD